MRSGSTGYGEEPLTQELRGERAPAVLARPAAGAAVAAVLVIADPLRADGADDREPGSAAPPPGPAASPPPGPAAGPPRGAGGLPCAFLARGLAARGHAVLRYADGWGGAGSLRARSARIGVALDALRRLCPGIAVAIAGCGTGAVMAALAAREHPGVAGVVALSCPSVRTLDLLRERVPLPTGDGPSAFDATVARIRAGLGVPAGTAGNATIAPFARLGPAALAYLREVDGVDPAAAVAAVPAPVLIVHDGTDALVGEPHAHRLAAARGDRPTQVALFPDARRDEPGTSLAPAIVERIDRWLRRL